MTKTAVTMLVDVLQAAGLPINDSTMANVRKVVEADLALVVASWIDLAHRDPETEVQLVSTPTEQLQAILRQFQEPLDKILFTLQGELGALAATAEAEGSEEEAHIQGIYNEAYDLRLHVKSFFETWTN